MKFLDLPLHHAVLLTHPDRKKLTDSLWEELRTLSPAHRLFSPTILDIDTARMIISWAQASYGDERVGLISFHTAGIPAQNALLKILEEPPLKTRFIIITTNKDTMLDTVLSRLSHHILPNDTENNTSEFSKLFLTTLPQQRMKLDAISKLLDKTDEENRKDREAVKEFILSLIPELRSSKVDSRFITETLEVASYASDTSSSGKALLEYLSLLLPQIRS